MQKLKYFIYRKSKNDKLNNKTKNTESNLEEELSESDEGSTPDNEDFLSMKKNLVKKRGIVRNESSAIDKDFVAKFFPKSEEINLRINNNLMKSFIFPNVEEKSKQIIIGAMEEKSFLANETIIKEGDNGNELFILDSGSADCSKIIEGEGKY